MPTSGVLQRLRMEDAREAGGTHGPHQLRAHQEIWSTGMSTKFPTLRDCLRELGRLIQ
jgi:hypothetical protein